MLDDVAFNSFKKSPPNFKDLTGQIVGNFKVIKRVENSKMGKSRWLCQCLCCGKEFITFRDSIYHSKSCGCQTNRIISEKNSTHGLRKTRLYNIWCKLRKRCTKPTDKLYSYYGGRGISVCETWLNDFLAFYNWSNTHGYAEDLTLDRIDVNGNYCPENCRWTTMKVQSNNRRNNRLVSYRGKTQTLKQWCEELNLDYKKTHRRIVYAGWSVERAFTQ